MKNTLQKYKEIDKVFDPFYSKESEALQHLVDAKTPLSESDSQALIDYLAEEKNQFHQYFVIDFLARYKEEIPKEFYGPVFDAGIKHRDPSFNRNFFTIAKKIRGEELFFEDLLETIRSGSDARKVMAVKSFYWNYNFYWAYVGEPKSYFEAEIKPHVANAQPRLNVVMEVLTHEFLSNENLIVRYALAEYLPRDIERYPKNLIEKGTTILTLIKSLGLPKKRRCTTPEFVHIWNQARLDPELGRLFFDELKWRDRAESPIKYLQEYEKNAKEEERRAELRKETKWSKALAFIRRLWRK